MFHISHIDHVALNVGNASEAAAWYVEVLGLERKYQDVWEDCPAVVCAGSTCLALFPSGSAPAPGSSGIRHVAFNVDYANFLQAQLELKQRGIPFHFEDHEICHSIYFTDPDGNQLELTTYDLPSTSGTVSPDDRFSGRG